MKRDTQTDATIHGRTSRLLDRIGPVGRFDEKYFIEVKDHEPVEEYTDSSVEVGQDMVSSPK